MKKKIMKKENSEESSFFRYILFSSVLHLLFLYLFSQLSFGMQVAIETEEEEQYYELEIIEERDAFEQPEPEPEPEPDSETDYIIDAEESEEEIEEPEEPEEEPEELEEEPEEPEEEPEEPEEEPEEPEEEPEEPEVEPEEPEVDEGSEEEDVVEEEGEDETPEEGVDEEENTPEGMVLSGQTPDYPKDASNIELEGRVHLLVEVSQNGEVESIDVIDSTDRQFESVASLTIQHAWEFKASRADYNIELAVDFDYSSGYEEVSIEFIELSFVE